ncbi:MAG: CIA30 family protein [Limnothrix sp. RL_2_0]|nr:CIA30 family protein [Limnothrix sp. RL_2_0]
MAMWDFGRLASTLIEFEVLPLSGCLKFLLGQSGTGAIVANVGGVVHMGQILLVGGDRPENQALEAVLSQKGYLLKRVTPASLTPDMVKASDLAIACVDVSVGQIRDLLTKAKDIGAWRSPSWMVFDFRQQTPAIAQAWGAVDDVVMGGVSASRLQLAPDLAYFTGIVSTENNGGFASIRTKNFANPWDLSQYNGFRLRVKGDGQRYKFIARCEDRWDGVGYSFSFDTIKDEWLTVDIPFADLIPVFRAKSVPERGKFNPTQVHAMQLMLSKFEYDGQLNPTFSAGAFSLGIASIGVYGGAAFPQMIVLSENTAPQEILQEFNVPYCLLHSPAGFTPDLFGRVTDTIGDRQKVNQVILCQN